MDRKAEQREIKQERKAEKRALKYGYLDPSVHSFGEHPDLLHDVGLHGEHPIPHGTHPHGLSHPWPGELGHYVEMDNYSSDHH